ncbi:hypothetical protein [Arsenicibacter rosenii]|uniref:Uncharacterized protein n=1 Tax=Arsenicibacter rosenii TaxID=1750698 RepID=A0A1S2VJ27_9BACT|nr:hypothetical protein [Arsenicibacter rosenii]OIN58749.1 hypothetical protein BLX24_14440 [Arsenicibacter rosenii]
MKPFINYILITLLFLGVGEVTAQTTVTLQGACATCPNSTTPNVLGEAVPCDGLTNVRDFAATNEYSMEFMGTGGFISKEGTVYVGWGSFQNQDNSAGLDECLTGRGIKIPGVSRMKAYTNKSDAFTAFPALNLLYYTPGQTFKALQRNINLFFALSDQGKIYNWGYFNNTAATGQGDNRFVAGKDTTTTTSDCAYFAIPREIKHPEGRAWKAMKIYNAFAYAADDLGKWWCWGKGRKTLFPSTQILLPGVGQDYFADIVSRFTPIRMDRLRVQPLVPNSDDQQTIAAYPTPEEGIRPSIAFIGVDSLLYVYKYVDNGVNRNFIKDTTMQIVIPGNYKAVKVCRPWGPGINSTHGDVYTVLATDGKIYYFFTDGTISQLSDNQYFFVDFVAKSAIFSTATTDPIESFRPGFAGVPRSRDKLVHWQKAADGSGYVYAETGGAEYELTSKISKIWIHGQFPNILVKTESGHSYVQTNISVDTSTQPQTINGGLTLNNMSRYETYVRAVGAQMSPGYTPPGQSSYGIPSAGFFKLINCFNIK